MTVEMTSSCRSKRMNVRQANMARLLAPRHIAFVGGRSAEMALASLRQHDYAGEVYVVHPTRESVGGLTCYRTLADLPVVPDAAYLGINAEATIAAVAELDRMGAGGAVCYASGFSEIGPAGEARNRRLIEAAGNLAVVGPNCFGLVNHVTHASMWTSGYQSLPATRGAAVVAQSGNVCIHLTSNQRSVPFSYLISAGNQAVLAFEDYITFLSDDPHVTCIGLFMEGIRSVAEFSSACLKARLKGVPVIVCRSGTSELGAALAASHTSSLAGRNDYYEALFARLGVIVTDTVPQFLEMLKLASLAPPFTGNRVAVFSSSGGDNGLAADYFSEAGLALPQPAAEAVARIGELLPDYGHVSNPLDFTAGYWGNEELLTPMFTAMLEGEVDCGVMVMDHPAPKVSPEPHEPILAMIRALASAGRATGKPVIMASVNPESIPEEVRDWMIGEGIIPLQGLHDAAWVIAAWAAHSRRRVADAAGGPIPQPPFAVPASAGEARTVNEWDAKQRLAACGLAIPEGQTLAFDEIGNLPEQFAAPVVLKVLDDRLPHKTEVEGVALNLATREEVRAAAERMLRAVAVRAPEVTPERFLMEPMLPPPLAELIVGVKRDPLFGMVLVIGAGGVLVELLKDARPLLLPVTREEVEEALRGLKSFILLDGFRGRPRARLDAVIDAIMAVARYAGENLDTLAELDVNPLMVFEDRSVAVDALIVESAGAGGG